MEIIETYGATVCFTAPTAYRAMLAKGKAPQLRTLRRAVSAGVVRAILQGHPDVAWAHVRGRKAPVVGAMVVAEAVLTPEAAARATGNATDNETLAELTAWCRERLPEYGVPRRIKLLDEIPATETLKSEV